MFMRCNVCGRELKPGQMFCQCGNTVNTAGTGGELSLNRGSSAKWIILAAVAGFVVIAMLAAIFIFGLVGHSRQLTDRSQWETRTCANYRITLPANMHESDIIDHEGSELTALDTYQSSAAIVDVNMLAFTEQQKKGLKRKKFVELFKELFPASEVNGYPVSPQEHGNMIYIEYPQDAPGIFWGSNEAWVTDACFVTNEAFYEVEVYIPSDKKEEYQEYVFAWLDSFRGN